ncbi:MAG: hypothetical protein ABWY57_05410 [Mycetocola sp.]
MTELRRAPESFAFPTVDRPLRAAEFDDLFRTSLRAIHRIAPTSTELALPRPAG